jgi:hypothetical protein
MLDQNLVDAIVRGKNLAGGSAKVSVYDALTRGHGFLLLERTILQRRR